MWKRLSDLTTVPTQWPHSRTILVIAILLNIVCAMCYRKFSLDDLLTNVMIYWVSGCIIPSMRFYKENIGRGVNQPHTKWVTKKEFMVTNWWQANKIINSVWAQSHIPDVKRILQVKVHQTRAQHKAMLGFALSQETKVLCASSLSQIGGESAAKVHPPCPNEGFMIYNLQLHHCTRALLIFSTFRFAAEQIASFSAHFPRHVDNKI